MYQRQTFRYGGDVSRGRVVGLFGDGKHTVGRRSSKAGVEHLQRLGNNVVLQACLQELFDRDDAVLVQVQLPEHVVDLWENCLKNIFI